MSDAVSTGVAFGASLIFGAWGAWKCLSAQSQDRRMHQVLDEVTQQSKSLEVLASQFKEVKNQFTEWTRHQAESEARNANRAEALRDALDGVKYNMSEASFTADVIAGKVRCAENRQELGWIAEWHGGAQPLPLCEAYEVQRHRVCTPPQAPAYASGKFKKGDPLGVLDEARLLKEATPVGVLRLRLLGLATKWGVQWRNEWAMNPKYATKSTSAISAQWSPEKQASIAEFSTLREDFIAELAANEVFDFQKDDSKSFADFLDKWESKLGPEKDGWPTALAFEKFED